MHSVRTTDLVPCTPCPTVCLQLAKHCHWTVCYSGIGWTSLTVSTLVSHQLRHVHWVLLQASVLYEPTARSRPRVCVSCSFCCPFSIMLTHITLWVVLIDSVYGVYGYIAYCCTWICLSPCQLSLIRWPNGGATVQCCTTQSSQHTLWCVLCVAALTIAALLCTNVLWVMCTVHMYTKHPHNKIMWDQYILYIT